MHEAYGELPSINEAPEQQSCKDPTLSISKYEYIVPEVEHGELIAQQN